jgi:hypothetical protein
MPEDDEYNAKPEEASIFALAQLGCTHPELDKRTPCPLQLFKPAKTPLFLLKTIVGCCGLISPGSICR